MVLKMSTKQLLTGDPRAREGREEFCVQLLTFIPGETLDSVPYTSRLAMKLGDTLAAWMQRYRYACINSNQVIWNS